MLLTVEGIYKDGHVELTETPGDIKHAKVLVTFLTPESPSSPSRRMSYGQFAGEKMSTEEDFRMAEWRGEAE